MCLGIPGQVIETYTAPAGLPMGRVRFGGIIKEVCLSFVPDIAVGDYVIVHVGFALNRLDETEAGRVLDLLDEALGPVEPDDAG